MSADTATVPSTASDAKVKGGSKKKTAAKTAKSGSSSSSTAKKVADHPKYSEMINAALTNLKERGGSSRQAVLKYIMKNFNVGTDESAVNAHLKLALKAGVKNASLKQSKGTGASGSFRIGSDAKKAATKAAKPKKAIAKKAKPVKSPKKKATTAAKKPSIQKSTTATAAKAKAPKAAKKPAVVKSKKPKAEKAKKSTSPVKKAKPAAAKKTPVKGKAAASKKA